MPGLSLYLLLPCNERDTFNYINHSEVIKGIEHIKGIQRVFWIILVVLVGAKEARPRNEIFDRMVQGCSEEHAINRLCLLLLACCFWKPCFSQSQSRGKDGNKSLSQQSTKCRTYH